MRARSFVPASLLAGLAHRAAGSLTVLLVALMASAAASTGPAYYASAKTSILRQNFADASALQSGVEITEQGEVAGAIAPLAGTVSVVVGQSLSSDQRSRLLPAPILATEASVYESTDQLTIPLVWRSDFCAHLRLTSGRCSSAPGQVAISSSLAARKHWMPGHVIRASGWPPLTVTGVYAIPDYNAGYWFSRGGNYFPAEDVQNQSDTTPADAMFTPRPTVDEASSDSQGILVVDQQIDAAAVRAQDLGPLTGLVHALQGSPTLTGAGGATTSLLPTLTGDIRRSWQALSVPIFLVTVELLLLVWVLMFIVVGDWIAARGPELALAKLRGRRGLRLLVFALGEPLTLLAVALPLGVLTAIGVCAAMDSVLLRSGTPVQLPALTWLAAGAATLGGVVATLVASRSTLRRPVVDQWQHASRQAARRGWVVDAVVFTAAAAGIAELVVGGHLTSVRQGSLGLLVPALLGLCTAVVASRALPALCRALFTATRRRGGLGPFLAVRHVARRSAAARTTVVLATAFALAAFGVASWSTGQSNRRFVADVAVGASTELDVDPTPGTDLGALVDRLDPGGTQAAVVDDVLDPSGGDQVLAVDPARFAHVAAWRTSFAPRPLATLMKEIAPPVAPQVRLVGDRIRVRLATHDLTPAGGVTASASLVVPGADGPIFDQLGTFEQTSGAVTFTTPLPGCPCTLDQLSLSATIGRGTGFRIQGGVTLDGIDVHDAAGWHTLNGLDRTSQWRADLIGATGTSSQTASTAGLAWTVDFGATSTANLVVADVPSPLPAVIDKASAGSAGLAQRQVTGLDQNALSVKPVAVSAAVPAALDGGVIVDRAYAERTASGSLSGLVQQQVWCASGAADRIVAGLRAAHVEVSAVHRADDQAEAYDRQGPGLASTAFLVDAIAAALLAAAGAVAGLVSAARRRRFEYAALRAAGASTRSLYAGLFLEQLVVLVSAAVAGLAAGIVAAVIAVRGVPEFVTTPATPPLTYTPSVGVLAITLVVAVVLLTVVAAVTSWILLVGAGPDQLRQAQA